MAVLIICQQNLNLVYKSRGIGCQKKFKQKDLTRCFSSFSRVHFRYALQQDREQSVLLCLFYDDEFVNFPTYSVKGFKSNLILKLKFENVTVDFHKNQFHSQQPVVLVSSYPYDNKVLLVFLPFGHLYYRFRLLDCILLLPYSHGQIEPEMDRGSSPAL